MTSIRPATGADMAAVADLWHEGWHAAHAGHVPDGLTHVRTLFSFHERTPPRVADTVVAVTDVEHGEGAVMGFAMVVGDEVEQLFVAPAWRSTGVAAELLTAAELRIAAAGHDEAWLAVVEGNARARRFYEKCGWSDGGELPYEVTAGGESFVSPCRRYVKALRT